MSGQANRRFSVDTGNLGSSGRGSALGGRMRHRLLSTQVLAASLETEPGAVVGRCRSTECST
jgi:hypothetical protein